MPSFRLHLCKKLQCPPPIKVWQCCIACGCLKFRQNGCSIFNVKTDQLDLRVPQQCKKESERGSAISAKLHPHFWTAVAATKKPKPGNQEFHERVGASNGVDLLMTHVKKALLLQAMATF